MRIVPKREIAGVDVHPAQRVSMPFVLAEKVFHDLLAHGPRQDRPHGGRGLGEGAAEAFQRLKAPRRIDPQQWTDLFGAWRQWRLFSKPRTAVAIAQPPAHAHDSFRPIDGVDVELGQPAGLEVAGLGKAIGDDKA